MNPSENPSRSASLEMPPAEKPASALSAFFDSELSPEDADALVFSENDPGELMDSWRAYNVIGDALRGTPVVPAAVSHEVFLAGVLARLPSEPVRTLSVEGAPVVHAPSPAANDAVFRWKLVAGLMSVTAVMAVSWSLVSSLLESPATSAPLALVSAPSASPQQSDPILVQTPQGQVLRDGRLEELLAEHRQFGGVSALQAPAGFLRNATYEAATQR